MAYPGSPGAPPLPQWDPILLFLHMFSTKSSHFRHWRPPPPNVVGPPMGNPRSATASKKFSKSITTVIMNGGMNELEEWKKSVSKTRGGCRKVWVNLPRSVPDKETIQLIINKIMRIILLIFYINFSDKLKFYCHSSKFHHKCWLLFQ